MAGRAEQNNNVIKRNTSSRATRWCMLAAATLFACGCGATTEFYGNNSFEMNDGGILINEPPIGDMDPGWATEAPRVDLFDPRNDASNASPNCAPGATGFSIDDIGITESCEPASEVLISGDGANPGMAARSEDYPKDEYLHDGGDRGQKVIVRGNWRIDGLNPQDTVAHFDTLAGTIEVVPSNKTRIYSPRFAATRQVQLLKQNRVNLEATRSTIVDRVAHHDAPTKFGAIKQPMGTVRAVGTSMGTVLEEHQQGLLVDDITLPHDYANMVSPFGNLAIVTRGIFEVDQQESVIHFANAAHAWSAVQFAQATVLGMVPTEQRNIRQAEAAVTYKMPDGEPLLRLVKLASASEALQGETVAFSLRFDNIGDQAIGNVTIIDNLTPRLEYVEDSEECTLKAEFEADDTSSDTLALRWEITKPLEPGEGGVITFKCRVR